MFFYYDSKRYYIDKPYVSVSDIKHYIGLENKHFWRTDNCYQDYALVIDGEIYGSDKNLKLIELSEHKNVTIEKVIVRNLFYPPLLQK